MGLNLPSRRVIIRDWWRYVSGLGLQPIPVMEIKQMAGRAGRPGLDDFGEAVLIARDRQDEKYLFNTYVMGKPENVVSRLADESALRTHILASIAGGFAATKEILSAFLGSSFFARQKGTARLASIVDRIVDFLAAEEMVVSDGTRMAATRFGARVAELYVDPLTAVVMKNSLRLATRAEPFPFLHMTARTPDMMVLQLRRRDVEEMLAVFHRESEGLLIPEAEKHADDELLAELKTAALLLDWIEERPEDGITDRFDVGPGDVHNLVRLAEWLLYSAGQLAGVFGLKDAGKALSILRTRIVYGVREELLPLVSLRGIGRVRARNLYSAGYRGLREIREAPVEALAKVPAIGKAIAEDIKRQVMTEVKERS
jgi:helicase